MLETILRLLILLGRTPDRPSLSAVVEGVDIMARIRVDASQPSAIVVARRLTIAYPDSPESVPTVIEFAVTDPIVTTVPPDVRLTLTLTDISALGKDSPPSAPFEFTVTAPVPDQPTILGVEVLEI